MRNEYRREMERLGPRQEELEQLYEMIEGGTLMNRKQKLGRQAVLTIAACAILTVTAAAAVIPTVWETLQTHLGAFAPYAQTIQGAVCRDQGVEVQVLSALSDDLETRVYLSVRDVEGDRLSQYLTLTGKLTTGERQPAEPDDRPATLSVGGISTGHFKLVSYDPETKTALLSASILYDENEQPTQRAQLALTGMTTTQGRLYGSVPCASVTGETLKSLPVTEQDKVVLSLNDLNLDYTEAYLPAQKVVLAPGHNPIPFDGTEDIWVSSIGFASDGCFHVRLGFAEGVELEYYQPGKADFFAHIMGENTNDTKYFAFHETRVAGGLDILFPLIKTSDLAVLQGCTAQIYGPYQRAGTDIEGTWDIQFPLTYYPSAVLGWTGQLAGRQVSQVTLSPLSVTMRSDDTGAFASHTLYAVKQDGSTVAAEPGTGNYSNAGRGTGATVWDAYNTWQFEEPVELEDIVSLTLLDETIPAG